MQLEIPYRHARARGHNYSEPGTYCLRLETAGEEALFGEDGDGGLRLNAFAEIAFEKLALAVQRYPCLRLDAARFTPDALEILVTITEYRNHKAENPELWGNRLRARRLMTIPMFVGFLKMNSARAINTARGTRGRAVWKRRYHDCIVAEAGEIQNIRCAFNAAMQRTQLTRDKANPSVRNLRTVLNEAFALFGEDHARAPRSEAQPTSGLLMLGRAVFLRDTVLRSPSMVSASSRTGKGKKKRSPTVTEMVDASLAMLHTVDPEAMLLSMAPG
ncbi:MAG TPA: hypothetical protein PK916_06295 [Bacteroidota bacterium]|nr:hypothetical protein [Bacteroidota bacterium]